MPLTNASPFISAGDLITVMSYKTLNKGTKAKKGISPVIATVILVAVAVVIAAALAGFSSSLFGSYSQSAQVQIRTMSIGTDGVDTSIRMEIVNKGGAPETVSSVVIENFDEARYSTTQTGEITLDDDTSAPVILANGEAVIHVQPGFIGVTTVPTPGATVTTTVTTQSGQSYTISSVVQDGLAF